MTPDVVVDIGNSRMKWGRVVAERVAEVAVFESDDSEIWFEQATKWHLDESTNWVIASVHPVATEAFVEWLGTGVGSVTVLVSHAQIPLPLDVESPESVGLDRLLSCLAAKKIADSDRPFLVIQAGTALVLNLVDATGAFAGGAILPGLTLMAKSLNEHTALLPEVRIHEAVEPAPGRTTASAIRSGIFWAGIGAILTLRAGYDEAATLPIYLTGGDAEVLLPAIPEPVFHIPDLVLEGIRIAAEARP